MPLNSGEIVWLIGVEGSVRERALAESFDVVLDELRANNPELITQR